MSEHDDEFIRHIFEVHVSRRHALRLAGLVASTSAIVFGGALPTQATSFGKQLAAPQAATSAAQTSTKDTLIYAASATPPGLDYDNLFSDQAAQGYNNVYIPLLRFKQVPVAGQNGVTTADFKTLEPQLAEDFSFSNNGQTITLRLKKGIMSHAGNELTSADFFWTRQRSLTLKAIGSFLLNSQGIKRIENIRVIDRYTVEVSSDEGPNPLLADGNTNPFFNLFDSVEVQKHIEGDDWGAKWLRGTSAGYGPYKLASLTAGQEMVWERHDGYWDGPAPIKTIIHREVPESANRLALISSGAVDIAEGLNPREIDSLKNNPDIQLVNIPSTAMGVVRLGFNHPPFDNLLVRQAFSYAFPYDAVLQSVYYGLTSRLTAPVPSIVPGYGDYTVYSENLDKAKQALADAGFPDGFSVDMHYDQGQSDIEQAAVLFQSNLQQIGVTISLNKEPGGTFNERLNQGEFALSMQRDGGPIQPDINYACGLSFLSRTDQRTCCNQNFYDNPQVTKGIEDARSIVDPTARVAAHIPIMKQIMQDAPMVFINNAGYQLAIRSNVTGVAFVTPQSIRFEHLSFA